MSDVLKILREIQAREDEEKLQECEEIVRAFLETHPDAKPYYPMDAEEFDDYMAFTHAVTTIEKIEKRRKKMAAEDALEEIIKDPLAVDDEPENSTPDYDDSESESEETKPEEPNTKSSSGDEKMTAAPPQKTDNHTDIPDQSDQNEEHSDFSH